MSFVLGDRPNLNTAIADDVVRVIYDHLVAIGRTDRIDVFLYTRGGVGVAPARIARLVREYTARMDVLVPYRCHSWECRNTASGPSRGGSISMKSSNEKKQFEVEPTDFIVIEPNEMIVVVPVSERTTYAPTAQNTVESSFSVAP